jgi:hypothetical protein
MAAMAAPAAAVSSSAGQLHPSWAAKIKLKKEAGKVSLLPAQGSKIRFED